MTKQLKYTFEKKRTTRATTIRLQRDIYDQIKEIAEREDNSLRDAFGVLLRVAIREYWEEREVKQEQEVEKPRRVGRPKKRGIEAKTERPRTRGTLVKGKSYCQYSKCPGKGQAYLTKNMIKYDNMVFCSDNCVDSFKHDQND